MYPFLDRALEICTDYFERWILGDAKDQGQVNDALSNAAATLRPVCSVPLRGRYAVGMSAVPAAGTTVRKKIGAAGSGTVVWGG